MSFNEEGQGNLLYKTSCDTCGSSDANAIYDSGTSYCFSCCTFARTEEREEENKMSNNRNDLLHLDYKDLKNRKISEKICKQYKYGVASDNKGQRVQVATYFDKDKQPIAQKLRYIDKKFKFIGTPHDALLYGQQLFGSGGKKLTITEGEIDTLSVAEAFDGKYPVVSIQNGAGSAKKAIAKQLEWVSSFDEIYLWLDNDEIGRKAVEECLMILPMGKVRVVQHSEYKDANEVLLNEGKQGIINTFYNALPYRPDGIVTVEEYREELQTPIEVGMKWFIEGLNDVTYGRRLGEVYTFGSGSGMGKTDVITQQIVYDIQELDKKVGVFFLEQTPAETFRRIAGKIGGKPYHIPNGNWEIKELNRDLDIIEESKNLFLYNSFGSTEWEVIESRIRYMRYNLGVELFYIDHITALSSHADDERRFIDSLMADVAGLAQELNVCILLISHLTTPQGGKSHEEGARVQANQFKGSRAILQWSHLMLGLERNNQADDVDERSKSIIRVLKDRYTGQATGVTIPMKYNNITGLLSESDETFDTVEDKEEDF